METGDLGDPGGAALKHVSLELEQDPGHAAILHQRMGGKTVVD